MEEFRKCINEKKGKDIFKFDLANDSNTTLRELKIMLPYLSRKARIDLGVEDKIYVYQRDPVIQFSEYYLILLLYFKLCFSLMSIYPGYYNINVVFKQGDTLLCFRMFTSKNYTLSFLPHYPSLKDSIDKDNITIFDFKKDNFRPTQHFMDYFKFMTPLRFLYNKDKALKEQRYVEFYSTAFLIFRDKSKQNDEAKKYIEKFLEIVNSIYPIPENVDDELLKCAKDFKVMFSL